MTHPFMIIVYVLTCIGIIVLVDTHPVTGERFECLLQRFVRA